MYITICLNNFGDGKLYYASQSRKNNLNFKKKGIANRFKVNAIYTSSGAHQGTTSMNLYHLFLLYYAPFNPFVNTGWRVEEYCYINIFYQHEKETSTVVLFSCFMKQITVSDPHVLLKHLNLSKKLMVDQLFSPFFYQCSTLITFQWPKWGFKSIKTHMYRYSRLKLFCVVAIQSKKKFEFLYKIDKLKN